MLYGRLWQVNAVAGDSKASKNKSLYSLYRDYNPFGKGKDLTATEAHSPALATCMPTAGRSETTQTMPSYVNLNGREKSRGC